MCVYPFHSTEERKSDWEIVYEMRAIPSCLSPNLFVKTQCRFRMTEKSIFQKALMDLLISHLHLTTHFPLLTYSPNQSIPLHGCQWKWLQAKRWWQVPARRGYNRYRAITPELEQTSWQMPNPPHMKPVYTYLSQRMREKLKERDKEWGGVYEGCLFFRQTGRKCLANVIQLADRILATRS